jgi:aspartate kinase
MSLVVLKFGGSSVGTPEKIAHVAQVIAKRRLKGDDLVVVVSAMQGETDRLLNLAKAIGERPDGREADQLVATGEQVSAALLALALHQLGMPARSLTASQMRLRTDGTFTKARIVGLDRKVVDAALQQGEVVVATGFQGIDAHGNITTLGRGGSDTSAVGIAVALSAEECDIYTDVLGVYTADPNVCPDARKLDEISFEEMLEMASQGSKVLQIRSVELAMNHKMPIRVRSTFSDDEGTLVRAEADSDLAIERLVVSGVSHDKGECKITIRGVPDKPGIAAKIFNALAKAQINVDVIVQNASKKGFTDLSFTAPRTDRVQAEDMVRKIAPEIGTSEVEVDDDIAKVSIVGVGMRSHPGVAAMMFQALFDAKINIEMITTSEIKVTCVIKRQDAEQAVRVLHAAFELHKAPPLIKKAAPAKKKPAAKARAKQKKSSKR